MCIIAYKPAGVQPPSESVLSNCFDANPDGAGLAIIRPSSDAVDIYKGFMNYDSFRDFAKAIGTPDDIVGYHFRIATSGGTRPENCHPFPLSSYPEDLRALSFHSRFAVLHNGVLGKGDDKLHLSDTMLYVKNVLAPRYPQSVDAEREAIAKETKGSRVLLMDGREHKAIMTGDGWVQSDGLWFSNHSFEDPPVPRYAYDWWWKDKDGKGKANDYPFDDVEDGVPCPLCGGYAEAISYSHDLLECMDCGALMNSRGETIYLVTEGGEEQ